MTVIQAVLGLWVQEPGRGSDPFVVKLIEPPGDPTGIADVIVGSFGLTGVLILIAIAAAVVMASGLVLAAFARSRIHGDDGRHRPASDHKVVSSSG